MAIVLGLLALLALVSLPVALWAILSGLYAVLFNMRPPYERWSEWSKKNNDMSLDAWIIWGFAYFDMAGRMFMGACMVGIIWMVFHAYWSGRFIVP